MSENLKVCTEEAKASIEIKTKTKKKSCNISVTFPGYLSKTLGTNSFGLMPCGTRVQLDCNENLTVYILSREKQVEAQYT